MERTQQPIQLHFDYLQFQQTQKLPSYYKKAAEYFEKLLKDDLWYNQHKGECVALLGESDDTMGFEFGPDSYTTQINAIARWGYRPIFLSEVTRERKPVFVRPRLKNGSVSTLEVRTMNSFY
jgi:hypothetical protein